jgi:hypothetical protein
MNGFSGLFSRSVSAYTNAAYIYNDRYTVSLSARKDGANIFGTSTNNKWKPLWSAGFKWDLDKELFYHLDWLPELKFRITYGYQGNVNNSIAGVLTTVTSSTLDRYLLPYSTILNNPNPDLRWEKIGQTNIALDYALKNDRISGTIEYYLKKGTDIIGETELPPSSGVTSISANTADIKGRGFDISINTRNLSGKIEWTTAFLFSYAHEWVTKYKIPPSTIDLYVNGGINPIVGKPVNALYSYRWAGLDPNSGNPQGYLNHQVSTNYAQLTTSTNLDDMIYEGPRVAPYFGSLTNSFRWKDLSFSFLIIYKFGNYFRRPSINYSSLFSGNPGHTDYTLRWQKPGDEKFTNVPSFVYPANLSRIYSYIFMPPISGCFGKQTKLD